MENQIPTKENTHQSCLGAEGIKNVQAYLQKLNDIWNDFGIDSDQRARRESAVWKHINNLLQEIYDEERAFYEDVKERIQNYTKKIEDLSKELSVTSMAENSMSLIKKEENLRQQLDSLTKLKHKRIKAYQELRNVESGYCSSLGIQEHQLSSSNSVPSESDLREIEQHIKMLKEEHERRRKKFCHVKKELTTILELTELTPETPLEKQLLSGGDSVSLTSEILKALEEVVTKAHQKKAEMEARKEDLFGKLTSLWDRLKVPESKKMEFLSKHKDCKVSTLKAIENEVEICEKIKKENIKMFVESLREELKELWNKCYISDSEKNKFSLYLTKEVTDEILVAHEKEVEKLKMYYKEVEHILTKIGQRNKLWDLLIEFENKATDPNRFKNRKGNLLQEEKERKKLQKDLPALENNIFWEIDLYESSYGKVFLYYGEEYKQFVSNQWQERLNQKENEKIERHKRVNLTENSKTPTKRTLLSTPKTTPSKFFKSSAGISVYRTPLTDKPKPTPNTIGKTSVLIKNKLLNSVQLSTVRGKLFSPINSQQKVKQVEQNAMILRERNRSKNPSESANATTYSQFASILNSTAKRSFRSSVLSTKKPGGSRISQNTNKTKRKSSSKVLRRSMRNVSKNTNLTPARGKLGLPFLI